MRTDLVVAFTPVGGGHKAAAIAIAEAARARGLRVELVDVFEHAPRWAGDAYLATHIAGQSATPELYGQMYFAANHRNSPFDPLRLRFDAIVFGGLLDRIGELEPAAIVATHHLPLVVLGRARRKGLLAAPVLGVVTDYTAHAVWAERGVDAWAVPLGDAREELARHGAEPDRIVETGIPVREAFEHVTPLAEPKRDVSVLVTSGGFGVGPMTRVVRSFVDVPDVSLTVVCGRARRLLAEIEEVAERNGVPARVLGFEKDMAARVAEADVVVGKAGGLTVTEALTAGRPMIITGAVPGNEALNEAFVVEGGAGVAAEPDHVGDTIARLRDAHAFASMGARARALVPTGAAANIVARALALTRPRGATPQSQAVWPSRKCVSIPARRPCQKGQSWMALGSLTRKTS